MNLGIKRMKSGDFLIVLITMAFVIFGVTMVFSASYYTAISDYGDPYYFLKREIIFAGIGTVLMLVTATIDYHIYQKIYWGILAASLVLLMLVFTPLGVTRNNATRWIGVGDLTLMPGEIAKLAVIIFVAIYLSSDPSHIRSLKYGVLPLFGVGGIFFGLIYMQPNLSTAITIFLIIVAMLFVAGAKLWHLGIVLGTGALLGFFAVFVDPDGGYRLSRVTSFLDPFADPLNTGYQVVQSLYALGSGGLFGVGIGKSIQKNLYLPEAHNDFILSIIGEELGFISIIILFLGYIFLLWRGIHIAINAKDLCGTLIASGVTLMLGIQIVLNVATVTSSMPPTGITLPFISYGGNAIWMFMIAMGLLINISRYKGK
ncbi:MAG: putative lipid II flippase FtsW [Anaerovoracaceae bacterium]|jgi:cell division protein FtsW|nr:putative lipid II flippase FtsW [Anaerovoracaceae bacterium]